MYRLDMYCGASLLRSLYMNKQRQRQRGVLTGLLTANGNAGKHTVVSSENAVRLPFSGEKKSTVNEN